MEPKVIKELRDMQRDDMQRDMQRVSAQRDVYHGNDSVLWYDSDGNQHAQAVSAEDRTDWTEWAQTQ